LVKGIPYPWVVVALALSAQMGIGWPSNGIPVLYPFIRDELSLSHAQVGLITSALAGGGVATAYLGGWLADVVGVKRVAVGLLVTMGVLMGAFPLTSSILTILILVVLVGVAQGPGYAIITRAIMDWIPRRTRGLAMGVRLTGGPLGGTLAAAVLPAVAIAVGWRVAAVMMGGLILLIGLGFLALYRDAPRHKATTPRMSFATLRMLMQNRGLVVATMWSAVFTALNVIIITYLILFLKEELKIPVVVAGAYLAVAQVSSFLARILWGVISDLLFGARRGVVLGIVGLLATLGLAGMGLLGAGAPGAMVGLLVVVLGLTMGWPGVFTTLAGELAGTAQIGTALGAVTTVMLVSVITIPPLFGLLVDVSGSYSLAWGAAAALALVSTVALMVFGKEPQREQG